MSKKLSLLITLFICLLLFSWCWLSEYKKEARNLYTAADERFKLEDYGGAIDDLNKAIELDPTYAQAFNMRGQIYLWFATMVGDPEMYDKALLNLWCSDLRQASVLTAGSLDSLEERIMKYCYDWIMSQKK